MMLRLAIDNLAYRYPGGRQVFGDFSLEAHAGTMYVLRGPNGSGKTTLLSLAAGWLTPTRGRVRRDGSVSYVPARLAFHENLTGWEELHYLAAAGTLGLDRLVAAATQWGFTAHELRQEISALSTGWRQRLALAVATCAQPDILLLDEPLANLDYEARRMALEWTQARLAEDAVVLMASHEEDLDLDSVAWVTVQLGTRTCERTPAAV